MNILTQQIDGDGDVELLDITDINDIDSVLTTVEWFNRSVQVFTPQANMVDAYNIGDILTLTGGAEFKLVAGRSDSLTDNWTMTQSGMVIRLTINNTMRSRATITSIYRHPWVFSAENSMDYYRRSFRLFGGNDNPMINPVQITRYNNGNNLLSETDFPDIDVDLIVYASKNVFLTDFELGSVDWDDIQYNVAGSGWNNYNRAVGIPLGAHLNGGTANYLDGFQVNLKLRFTHSESTIHKWRDDYIHNTAGYMTTSHRTKSTELHIQGDMDHVVDGNIVETTIHRSPFDVWGVSVPTGAVRIDTVKVRVVDADNNTPATSIDSMARVFQDSEFDGNWLTILSSSFTQTGGLSTSIKDVNDTLPSDAWLALDNGMLIKVVDDEIVESYMSSLKWNGSARFNRVSGQNSSVIVTGDTIIYDTDIDSVMFPYPINNLASLRFQSTGPLNNLSLSNGDGVNSIPTGTLSLHRNQWDTMFNGEMMFGDFYEHENDKEELEKVKQKPSHDYTVDLRKIPGYQFDLDYPNETSRTYTIDLNTQTGVYTIGGDVVNQSETQQVSISIQRNLTRWKSHELPRLSTQDTTWQNDTGYGDVIARRVWTTSYYDLEHWLETNTEVETNFGDNPGDNGFTVFDNDRTTLETATGPYNTPNVKIFKSISETARTGGNGGFVRHDSTGWDTSHNYATVVYVMREGPDFNGGTSNGGNYYHGCGWWTQDDDVRNLNGSINTNPYFGVTRLNQMTPGEWYISIAFLRNINGTSTTKWGGGLWNLTTGHKLKSYTDFRIGSTGKRRHRCFQYYCPTDTRELHQCGFMDFDMTDRGWSYQHVLDTFVPGYNKSAVTVPQVVHHRTHEDLSGAWSVEGSLQGRGALNVDGTDHAYTRGVLVESKDLGAATNQIVLQQSDNALILPKATLDGGFNGADKPVVSGGQPGDAIRCIDAATTINNNGTITGNINRQ